MRKKSLFAMLIALVTILSVACVGQQQPQSASGNQNQIAQNGGTTGQSHTDDSVLTKMKASGVINVGIEGAYPPFNYFNNKNELEGFDVDITNEIARRMGVKANFIPTPWDSIITGLIAKKYDIILSSMAITEERMKKVDFTDPYYHTGSQLFVPNDSPITDPTKIKGLKIGATIGTTFEKKAMELGAELVTYKNDLLAFTDLANGRIQGVITDKAVGARLVKEKNYPIKPVGDPLILEEAGIALNKNEEALRNEINKHLRDMMNDGTYEKISKKWFGQDIR